MAPCFDTLQAPDACCEWSLPRSVETSYMSTGTTCVGFSCPLLCNYLYNYLCNHLYNLLLQSFDVDEEDSDSGYQEAQDLQKSVSLQVQRG